MKVGMVVGMVCAVMLACGGGESENAAATARERLRRAVAAEKQLSIAEERLAAYEDATIAYEARLACNMKIAVALLAVVGSRTDEEIDEDLWDFVKIWRDSSVPLIARYVGTSEYVLDIGEVVGDLRSGQC